MQVFCIAPMLLRRESACSNCIFLEPTDVVIVGTSQTFAEMFTPLFAQFALVVFKQVWLRRRIKD
jgi:hypothetical protein